MSALFLVRNHLVHYALSAPTGMPSSRIVRTLKTALRPCSALSDRQCLCPFALSVYPESPDLSYVGNERTWLQTALLVSVTDFLVHSFSMPRSPSAISRFEPSKCFSLYQGLAHLFWVSHCLSSASWLHEWAYAVAWRRKRIICYI